MSTRNNHFFSAFRPIFTPPFEGLWFVVLLYYVWCYMMYPDSDLKRGNLPDSDDYMYLVQIIDWLKGQAWYDNIQHRMNPPEGVPIHFSRLAQIPIALLMIPFQWLGLKPVGAGTLAALFEPIILLAFQFLSLRKLVVFFVPQRWAGASSYVAMFALGMLFMFMPGHVDHHGLVVLLSTIALAQLCTFLLKPEKWGAALWAGLALALSMTIALEILPWLLLMSLWLGVAGVARGGKTAQTNLIFATSLLIGSTIGLLLNRPPNEFFNLDILVYSFVYVALILGIWLAFVAVALAAKFSPLMRWIIGIASAVISGGLYLYKFPTMIAGPYGAIDPEISRIILDEVQEARPLLYLEHSWRALLVTLPQLLITLPFTAYCLYRSRGTRFWIWGLIALLYVVATILTLFFQSRCIGMMATVGVIPLTVFLHRGWGLIQLHLQNRKKAYAEILLVLLVGPLLTVIIPGFIDGRSMNYGLFMFIAARAPNNCDQYELTHVLMDKQFMERPQLVLSMMNDGPEILFRTPHMVLGAPFHMNITGNRDTVRFFSTPYVQEAENIVRRRKVDLIVACSTYPKIFLEKSYSPGAQNDESPDFAPHMIERLISVHTPDWLAPVVYKKMTNFAVYKVLPDNVHNYMPMLPLPDSMTK